MINRPRIKISELCNVIVDCVNKTAPIVEHDTPYKMIRTPNIKGGRINIDGCRFVEQEVYEKWTRRAKVNKDDVLLTREAPMGRVGIVTFQDTVFLGQRIMQYRANLDKLNPKFLLYSFLSPDLQFQFRRHNNSGSTVSHIRVPDCFEFEIPTPSIEEQNDIAKILSDLDAKIELNDKINAKLEAMAKLIYDYWFVQFDFPDKNGKPYKSSGGKLIFNEELRREIPEGWEVNNILRVGELLGGGTPKTKEPSFWNGNIPFFTPADHSGTTFSLITKQNVTAQGLESCSSKLHSKGTVFITARGSVGKINIASKDMAMNQSCYAIKSKPKVNYYYLHQCVIDFVHYLKAKSSGSIFDAIVSNDIKLTPIVVAPNDLISQYGELIGAQYERILVNSNENQKLAELRDWLLPMLMNGQVKVN